MVNSVYIHVRAARARVCVCVSVCVCVCVCVCVLYIVSLLHDSGEHAGVYIHVCIKILLVQD